MNSLKDYILNQVSRKELDTENALSYLKEIEDKNSPDNKIAIIGMACKLPEAENYEEFRDNLLNERECLNYMPKEFEDYYKISEDPRFAEVLGIKVNKISENRLKDRGAYIKDSDKFDANFFNIAPREAKYMDPSQRVFLEVATSAIEDAGYALSELTGENVGVFVGKDHNSSEFYKMSTVPDSLNETGNRHGILASRISYILNLRGPAMVIDTACSSGLVCVHEACRSLQSGDSSMAIAGGISLGGGGGASSDEGEPTDALTSVIAKDSTVRAFDKKSGGTVFGEGCVALLLKPLDKAIEDNDFIHGIISASVANNDGASNGITAPNPASQTDLILKAWDDAKIDPLKISYIETHGTGTHLGDPIEFKAINNAFRKYTTKRQFCAIGSVKSNVGHLIGASGCTGLMKVILSMKNRTLPASINFEEPNPHINFIDSALFINDITNDRGNDNETLYAGISSFGFSGTNVHVIVESVSDYYKGEKNPHPKQRILTISGKSKSSLIKNIENYSNFIDKNPDINLDSLVATSTLGRGHYNQRVAIIFNDYEDLKKKINKLKRCGIDNISSDIYYGNFKVVSDLREDLSDGELKESDIKEINKLSKEITQKIRANEASDKDYILLSKYYTMGALIDRAELFDEIPKKIPIPTYAFDKTLYRGDLKVLNEGSGKNVSESYDHPLVENCLIKSIEEDIYMTRFNVKKHRVLHDHVIMGKNILPGTAYVEIAREACSKYIDGEMEIKNLTFMTPLTVGEEEEVEAQIIVKKLKDHLEFMMVTEKNADDLEEQKRIKHMEGKAYKLETDLIPQKLDLSFLDDPNLLSKSVTLSKLGSDAPMCFGPRWDNVRRVYISDTYKYVDAKLPDEFSDDLKVFKQHTSLLDEAVNAGVLAEKEQMYLPFMFKSIKLYKPLTQQVYSRAICKDKEGSSDEISVYDIILTDKNGDPLVEITDYSVKKVHKFDDYEDKVYYRLDWIKSDCDNKLKESLGNVVIFGAENLDFDLAKKLKEKAKDIIYIKNGDSYLKENVNNYTLSTKEDDYKKIFEELSKAEFNTILHLGSLNFEEKVDTYNIDNNLDKGARSLFMIVKSLIKAKIRGDKDIIILTNGTSIVKEDDMTIKPINASLAGVAKCITDEYPSLKTRIIDIDQKRDNEVIINEILKENYKTYTALRKNERYEKILNKFERTNQLDEIDLNIDGVILITGGLGGLGLEAAKYMAYRGAKDICLTARSEFPSEDMWPDILKDEHETKYHNSIKIIKELRDKGVNIFIRKADVSDKDQMQILFKELNDEYKKISIVMHLAGIAGDGFIVNKNLDTFNEVLSPKIIGTEVLNELIDWDNLDLFIAYSSITSLMGAAGQSDYTAANSYIDSFAEKCSKEKKPIVTLNRPAWSEVGMAFDYNVFDEMTIFKSLDNKMAIEFLNDAINYRLNNVVPAAINYNALAMIKSQLPINLSRSIQRAVDIAEKKMEGDNNQRRKSIEDIILIGKASGDYTITENKVAAIYASVLGINEIDIYDNYNALGGNSMTSTEILKILNEYFDNVLDVSDVFSYPTVYEMSLYLDNKTLNDEKEEKENEININEALDKFQSGELEVDKMLELFND